MMNVCLGLPLALQRAAAELDTTRESWRLLDVPEPWIIVLILIPAAVLVSSISYWRENLSSGIRATLIGLRLLSIALLLLVLFRPVKVKHQDLDIFWVCDDLFICLGQEMVTVTQSCHHISIGEML